MSQSQLLPALSADTRAQLEKKTGKIGQEIGEGQNGQAFALADPTLVLKLTLDQVEARSALALMKRPMDEAVHVSGVWDLEEDDENGAPIFAILMERLVPLPDRARQFINDWRMWSLDERATFSPQAVKEFLADSGADVAAQDEYGKLARWMLRAVRGLVERQIYDRDLHANNVMARPSGDLVIFDIGADSDAPFAPIKRLAAMLEALASRLGG